MRDVQLMVREFMAACGQTQSLDFSMPTEDSVVMFLKCLLEEVKEVADAYGANFEFDENGKPVVTPKLEKGYQVYPAEALDGLGDIFVFLCVGANQLGADLETTVKKRIQPNNMTKLEDGYLNEYGKLMKGPKYKPLDPMALVADQVYLPEEIKDQHAAAIEKGKARQLAKKDT